jgi:cyclomaltodextrinase / maltogenic alpha-amylase / neopullulanase
LGPVFQSTSHGYDTVDYFQVDRRLGDHHSLERIANAIHQRGMRLVLDGVFNHVGRNFWAFKDVLAHGEKSAYCDWFHLRFGETSPLGDPFHYEGWQGHYNLVKLKLSCPEVRTTLFDTVSFWIDQFGIDGLRLDAADCMEMDFFKALNKVTKAKRSDFWLMGEVVHGDYRQWVCPGALDSVTNYEVYKGLYSSLNDRNYFEIAYSLNRQFGSQGIYRHMRHYNFADNHDVDRVASKISDPAHLYPLYVLLFTMPGIPSVYYGSEWGIEGVKRNGSDDHLRPALDLKFIQDNMGKSDLAAFLHQLATARKQSAALCSGTYQQCHVGHQQFVFLRQTDQEAVLVALNSASEDVKVEIDLPWKSGEWMDILDPGKTSTVMDGRIQLTLPPSYGRIMKQIS